MGVLAGRAPRSPWIKDPDLRIPTRMHPDRKQYLPSGWVMRRDSPSLQAQRTHVVL